MDDQFDNATKYLMQDIYVKRIKDILLEGGMDEKSADRWLRRPRLPLECQSPLKVIYSTNRSDLWRQVYDLASKDASK